MTRFDLEYRAPDSGDLRKLREAAGLSLRAFAARIRYSTSHLSRVETGKKAATPSLVRLYTTLPSPAEAAEGARRTKKTASPPRRPPAAADLEPGAVWFGEELRRLRLAAGKSLRDLGAEIPMSSSQLGKIEVGDARATHRLAQLMDNALGTRGRLATLFLAECARVGPVAPDTDILIRRTLKPSDPAGPDPEEYAAAAAIRLESLRIRSHHDGPASIIGDLGAGVAALHLAAGDRPRTSSDPVWHVRIRYAELLSWTAQEIGNDTKALHWLGAVADWARVLSDADALAYALIRQSQLARRHGDAPAAADFALRAGAVRGLSPRVALFAAQRQAQAWALAGEEQEFRRALRRYHAYTSAPSYAYGDQGLAPVMQWGPRLDPAFEQSQLFEATCLIDLGDFRTAAALFDQSAAALGTGRTGYTRLGIRRAIAYANVGEPERAVEVAVGSLPTVNLLGSASLRGDLKLLNRVLASRYGTAAGVRELLPHLTKVAHATRATRPSPPS